MGDRISRGKLPVRYTYTHSVDELIASDLKSVESLAGGVESDRILPIGATTTEERVSNVVFESQVSRSSKFRRVV